MDQEEFTTAIKIIDKYNSLPENNVISLRELLFYKILFLKASKYIENKFWSDFEKTILN